MQKTLKLLLCIIAILILSISLIACDDETQQEQTIYDVDNIYFSNPTFKKEVHTRVGVNSSASSGDAYYINITTHCSVDIISYEIVVSFLNDNGSVLKTQTYSKNVNKYAFEKITLSEEVTENVFTSTTSIQLTASAKSYQQPTNPIFNSQLSSTDLTELKRIDLLSKNQAIEIGDIYNVNFDTYPLGLNSMVQWSSSNNNVATVNNGQVVGLSAGITQITAKYKDITTSFYIKVMEPYKSSAYSAFYSRANASQIKIENLGYNSTNIFGKPKDGQYTMINATVIYKNSNSCYFIAPKDSLDVLNGYKYQKCTVVVDEDTEYEVKGLKEYDDYYIGYVSTTDFKPVTIFDKEQLFLDERLYFKTKGKTTNAYCDTYTYLYDYIEFSHEINGAGVYDSDYRFIGVIIGGNKFGEDVVILSSKEILKIISSLS